MSELINVSYFLNQKIFSIHFLHFNAIFRQFFSSVTICGTFLNFIIIFRQFLKNEFLLIFSNKISFHFFNFNNFSAFPFKFIGFFHYFLKLNDFSRCLLKFNSLWHGSLIFNSLSRQSFEFDGFYRHLIFTFSIRTLIFIIFRHFFYGLFFNLMGLPAIVLFLWFSIYFEGFSHFSQI